MGQQMATPTALSTAVPQRILRPTSQCRGPRTLCCRVYQYPKSPLRQMYSARRYYCCISGLVYMCKDDLSSASCLRLRVNSLAITQYIGAPLYLIKKDYYYRYMTFTKQGMALLVLSMTQWWTKTELHISGDESVKDQIRTRPDGRVECRFADRLVLIANHQVFENRLSHCVYSNYVLGRCTTIGSTSGGPPTPPTSTAPSTSSSKTALNTSQ